MYVQVSVCVCLKRIVNEKEHSGRGKCQLGKYVQQMDFKWFLEGQGDELPSG